MGTAKCPRFKDCPIVKKYEEKQKHFKFHHGSSIEICGDDLRFYDPEFLSDDEAARYCSKLRKLKERLKGIRITWKAPVFGPSGYAFAARGYIIGLNNLGVRINVQPIWGDCKITVENEVEKDAGRV